MNEAIDQTNEHEEVEYCGECRALLDGAGVCKACNEGDVEPTGIVEIEYKVGGAGEYVLKMPDWTVLDPSHFDECLAEAQALSNEAVEKAHAWGLWAINHAWIVGQGLVRAKEREIYKGRKVFVCSIVECDCRRLDDGRTTDGDACGEACEGKLKAVDLNFVTYCEIVTGRSHKTATKYMALARANPIRPPLEMQGLNKAFQAAGLVPETATNKVPPEERATQSYLSGIMQVERWWKGGEAVKKLEPAQKAQLRKQFEPIARIFVELGGLLTEED